MRYFYEVLIADQMYHGTSSLTYSSEELLKVGSFVSIELKNRQVRGIVYKSSTEQKFKHPIKKIDHKLDLPALPVETISLMNWVQIFYPASVGAIAKHFLPSSLFNTRFDLASYGDIKFDKPTTLKLPALTDEQSIAMKQSDSSGSYLLHGETGSGKTRIYLEHAYQAYLNSRSSIILTPEIALTRQLYLTFASVFGNRVLVLHSKLTDKERRDIWLKIILSKEPLIVIGPRSAIFVPLKNIGLIVVDEAHEDAYKQEVTPFYHANRVATKLGQLHGAVTLLGSATPSVVDYYIAQQKNIKILRLSKLATTNHDLKTTEIEIIDLKDKTAFTKSPIMSNKLLDKLQKNLSAKEQSLIFLNRRGTARVVICNNCGWQDLCPNCDIPLTFHADDYILLCHICNYHKKPVYECPVCKNTDITFKGIGTKALVTELQKRFPEARILRFDGDNKKSERLEQHYEAILAGEVDIIVGTQTLGKGLDLPNLSLVGVIAADTNLYIPDYTSQEKMYQLISQVIGRIGRGHRSGSALIQTYLPNNPVLKAAVNKDWQSFYDTEISERKHYMFPPFCYLLKLSCKRANSKSSENAATKLVELLNNSRLKILVSDPTPAFQEKRGKKYRWQIVVKSKNRSELIKLIGLLPSGWSYDIDPINLL